MPMIQRSPWMQRAGDRFRHAGAARSGEALPRLDRRLATNLSLAEYYLVGTPVPAGELLVDPCRFLLTQYNARLACRPDRDHATSQPVGLVRRPQAGMASRDLPQPRQLALAADMERLRQISPPVCADGLGVVGDR